MKAEHIAWGWIAFYALFTLYQLTQGLKLFDYVVYILILVGLLLSTKRFTLPKSTVWFLGLATLLHVLGTISFTVNGETVSLYHDMFFGGNYDLVTHAYGLLMLALALLTWYHAHHPTNGLTNALLFLALIGAGTIVEMCEFAGYKYFGFGWGAFAFGAGDNSMNFGPWGDSMTDTYANVVGIALGFLVYFVWRKAINKQ